MSGISVWCGYLLNTIDVGADWTCKCHTGCVGKIFMTATESTNTSECRNADKTGASSLANLNSHSKIKPDGKRSLWRNGWSEVIAAQPCPTLCDPMDCGATRLPRPWDSPGKNTGVACHALLQGIFLTQGMNPVLLHWRQTLYCLSHQGNPGEEMVKHGKQLESANEGKKNPEESVKWNISNTKQYAINKTCLRSRFVTRWKPQKNTSSREML